MKGTSIYDLVSAAYQVTLVGAFVPLVMGLYWKRATTQGAILSLALGIATWIVAFPQLTAGRACSRASWPGCWRRLLGMIVRLAGAAGAARTGTSRTRPR